jgi:hypothetical protein
MEELMETLKAVVTIALLVVAGVFVTFLLRQLGASETEWSRAVFVWSGVEAVLFAAVGWFFGKEVNRERAEAAEREAAKAQAETSAARTDAATAKEDAATARSFGESLTAAILSKSGSSVELGMVAPASRPHAEAEAQRALGELGRLAISLFPKAPHP